MLRAHYLSVLVAAAIAAQAQPAPPAEPAAPLFSEEQMVAWSVRAAKLANIKPLLDEIAAAKLGAQSATYFLLRLSGDPRVPPVLAAADPDGRGALCALAYALKKGAHVGAVLKSLPGHLKQIKATAKITVAELLGVAGQADVRTVSDPELIPLYQACAALGDLSCDRVDYGDVSFDPPLLWAPLTPKELGTLAPLLAPLANTGELKVLAAWHPRGQAAHTFAALDSAEEYRAVERDALEERASREGIQRASLLGSSAETRPARDGKPPRPQWVVELELSRSQEKWLQTRWYVPYATRCAVFVFTRPKDGGDPARGLAMRAAESMTGPPIPEARPSLPCSRYLSPAPS